MNLLSYCALVLLLGLSLGMFVRLFRRVYAGGGDTVQVSFFSWVDLVLASMIVLLIVSQILVPTGSVSQTAVDHVDTLTLLANILIWWALILGPILLSLWFRGFKLGNVFGLDRMPGRGSLLGGHAVLVCALPT